MGYIAVYQSLIGGKLRELHKAMECSRNEAIGMLNGLWLWAMDNATEDGLLRGCDREDIIEQLSIGMHREVSPERAYDALVSGKWLEEKEDGIYIHDWAEAQEPYYRWINDKKRNRERQKRFRERHAEDNVNSNEESNVTKEENKEQKPEKKEERYAEPGFNEFWKIYPRKNDKGQAYRKYKARIKDGYRPEELIAAATVYAAECKRQRTEQQYIKHAKTFLGDSTPFLEYITKKQDAAPVRAPGENPFL